jgi:hypothetical protein
LPNAFAPKELVIKQKGALTAVSALGVAAIPLKNCYFGRALEVVGRDFVAKELVLNGIVAKIWLN